MKKSSLLLLTSFFLVIPSVLADSCSNKGTYTACTTNKYHYYFFSRPYTQEQYDTDSNYINYTMFAGYKAWEEVSPKEITLDNGIYAVDGSETHWNYSKFYCMWDQLDKYGKYYAGDSISDPSDPEKRTKEIKNASGTFIYHAHGGNSTEPPYRTTNWGYSGSFSADTPSSDAKGVVNACIPISGEIRAANASVEARNNLKLVNYYGGELTTNTGSDKTYISISRTLLTEKDDIEWTSASEENESGTGEQDKVVARDGKVYASALYRVTATTTNYKCNSKKIDDKGQCNTTNSASGECGKHTIEVKTGDEVTSRATITISQEGSVTNVLTPTEIYQGGGVKLGFVYYNTVTWQYAADEAKYGNMSSIENAINDKIKNDGTLEDNIKVNIEFKDKNNKSYTLNSVPIQKKCTQEIKNNTGLQGGQTITTVCTFLLPESTVALGSGKVQYKNSIGKGINNEYYTPIKYKGDFIFKATISDIGVVTGLNGWMEDWKLTYDGTDDPSCKINIYERLYKGNNYRFIYRPIDLKNPFPNRVAGVNWYEWYKDPFNKNRLEESYSKMEYQAELNTQNVSAIKEYNKNNNYLDWTGINENGKSDFVDENVTRVGGS